MARRLGRVRHSVVCIEPREQVEVGHADHLEAPRQPPPARRVEGPVDEGPERRVRVVGAVEMGSNQLGAVVIRRLKAEVHPTRDVPGISPTWVVVDLAKERVVDRAAGVPVAGDRVILHEMHVAVNEEREHNRPAGIDGQRPPRRRRRGARRRDGDDLPALEDEVRRHQALLVAGGGGGHGGDH